jgi:peptidoglycan hydrolase CwlO-like protein
MSQITMYRAVEETHGIVKNTKILNSVLSKMDELTNKINELTVKINEVNKKIEELGNAILYMPGNEEMKKAEDRFIGNITILNQKNDL